MVPMGVPLGKWIQTHDSPDVQRLSPRAFQNPNTPNSGHTCVLPLTCSDALPAAIIEESVVRPAEDVRPLDRCSVRRAQQTCTAFSACVPPRRETVCSQETKWLLQATTAHLSSLLLPWWTLSLLFFSLSIWVCRFPHRAG